MEGFTEEGWGRELLAKQDIFKEGMECKSFVIQIASSSSGGLRGPMGQINFFILHQKITDCSTEITFQGDVKTAVRLGVKSRFLIMGF